MLSLTGGEEEKGKTLADFSLKTAEVCRGGSDRRVYHDTGRGGAGRGLQGRREGKEKSVRQIEPLASSRHPYHLFKRGRDPFFLHLREKGGIGRLAL